ncbi:unnamed protein product [Mytilus coruscus]|uniref:Uncharacterized protein n=1 Tax=Mytilus coruscus TaxID=42192 RepID=A0A6J8DJV6_MYTCO|nr:unnamed protein product [Mytilus coruscus]
MGAGGIAIIMALGSCCLKYKRKAANFHNSRFPRIHNNIAAVERENIRRNNENANDLIDENTMIDNRTLIRIVTSTEYVNQAGMRYSATVDKDWISGSFSFSDEDVSEPANEGFSNSYLSMTEVDIHPTLPNETTQNFENISSGNSEPIINSAVQIYGNINPYQQVIPFGDLDKAVTKHKNIEQSMSDFQKGNDGSHFEDTEQISFC